MVTAVVGLGTAVLAFPGTAGATSTLTDVLFAVPLLARPARSDELPHRPGFEPAGSDRAR